jgi:hypothetical protein
MIYDRLMYLLKLLGRIFDAMSIIYWDIDAPLSLAPHPFDAPGDRPVIEFSEDADRIASDRRSE